VDRLVVEVRHAVDAKIVGTRAVIEPGHELAIGRIAPADVAIADEQLSGRHFRIRWNGSTAFLEDLASISGTFLQGERLGPKRVIVEHGAWIRAGRADFMVYEEARTLKRRPELLELSPLAQRAHQAVSCEPHPLFGVIDCARDARLLPLMREAVDPHRCLLEGPAGRASADNAPHLVQFRDDSDLLRVLLGIGWGRRLGIFASSPKPFEEVRRHFRRLLLVTDEETNEQLYFRFYDPAVLRTYLAAATRAHRSLMFGPISAYFVEAPNREVERLTELEPLRA
jgi:hypothetical protein